MDATKGPGSRQGTRSNPLGLERSQNAAINYGMNSSSAYRPSPRKSALPPAKKPSTAGTARTAGTAAKKPRTGTAGVAAKKNVGSAAGTAAKKPVTPSTGAPKKPATGGPSQTPATGGLSSGKTRVSAASRPMAKAGTAAKK